MSTEATSRTGRTGPASGALLLCRAEPGSVAHAAQLLRESMLLARAGDGWSVLVPEGRPWLDGDEPVDRVLTGWAGALAVGVPWPVLALWWDAHRSGYTLASGFRRSVGYVWLSNGTPAGEDEAMHTFAACLALDPVLDVQSLDHLTRPDPASDARARLRGLLAVLTRVGLTLPTGLTPGEPADRLREAARRLPDVRPIDREGRQETVRDEYEVVSGRRLTSWPPWPGDPNLALAQVAVGLPLAAWGLRHRSGGWLTAGALLLAHGTLGLAYDLTHPRD